MVAVLHSGRGVAVRVPDQGGTAPAPWPPSSRGTGAARAARRTAGRTRPGSASAIAAASSSVDAHPLRQLVRRRERPLHRELLVELHADEQRERVAGQQLVRFGNLTQVHLDHAPSVPRPRGTRSAARDRTVAPLLAPAADHTRAPQGQRRSRALEALDLTPGPLRCVRSAAVRFLGYRRCIPRFSRWRRLRASAGLHGGELELEGDLLADEDAAGLERGVPVDAPVLAVDRRPSPRSRGAGCRTGRRRCR